MQSYFSGNRNGIRDSAWKPLLLGGVCGFVSGRIFSKVGKLAAIAVSSGLLAIHVMHRQGFITIDKDKMKNALHQAKDQIKDQVKLEKGNLPRVGAVAQYIGEDYKYVVVGFSGGFLVGLL